MNCFSLVMLPEVGNRSKGKGAWCCLSNRFKKKMGVEITQLIIQSATFGTT